MPRSLRAASLAFALLVGALGCDTTQPTQLESSNAQVLMGGTVGSVEIFDVWDATLVTTSTYEDGRKFSLDEPLGLWCDVPAGAKTRSNVVYPVRFAIKVERIPAGSSSPIVLTGPEYENPLAYACITAYDPTPALPPTTHPVDWSLDVTDPSEPLDIGVVSVVKVVEFRNGRLVSTASADFLRTPKLFAAYDSRCPYGGLGQASSPSAYFDPTVAGGYPSFDLDLEPGDTVVVRVTKDPSALSWVRYVGEDGPQLVSTLLVAGGDVSDGLIGSAVSLPSTDDVIAYSYTQR